MAPPLFAGVCHLLLAFQQQQLLRVRRLAHFCIGLSCFSFLLGQIAWTYYETIRDVGVPFPGWTDVWYLGAFPLLGLGIVLLFGLTTPWTRLRLVVDGAIASSGIGIVSWYFLVSAWWAKSGLTGTGKVVIAAYPLFDIALVFSALTFLSSAYAEKENRASTLALSGGVCLIAFADLLFSYYTLNEWYSTGSWFDWGYSFGWISIAYAALLPLWKQRAAREGVRSSQKAQAQITDAFEDKVVTARPLNPLWVLRLLLPYLLAFAAWVIVVSHDYRQDHIISTSTYVSGFWLLSLVILRQVMTMLHNHQLTHRLQEFNLSLEQTIARRTHQIKSLFELTKAVNNTLQASDVLESALLHTRDCLNAGAVAIRLCETGDCAQSASMLEQGLEGRPAVFEWIKELELARQVENTSVPGDEAGMLLRSPLMWRDTRLGDISALRMGEGAFSQGESEMLESIAIEVAAAYRNAQIHAAAVEHADRDSITGLFNHRAIHERLQSELERAERLKRPLAVIMMDLNNFKLFNDTYGHPVGDQVLKRVAIALESRCRKLDVLGRYGGDEFIAVLPETDLPLALVVAQRWRERMELEGFHFAGDQERVIPVSLSFGIATYPADSTNRFELISIADANLYTAKLSEKGIVGTSETQRQNRQLRTESSFDVLDAMVTAVDNKDSYTRRHSEDVTEFALWIAEELGSSSATMRVVRLAGLLHDVGKIGVPEAVLKKPGRLTSEEFDVMKGHAQFGAFIVGGVPDMNEIVPGVKSHHERWDGRGYPDGLAGEAIPFLGRLLAVADACSAMTTSRPYRQALDWKAAMQEIEANIGTQFDPEIAVAFLRAARKKRPDAADAKTPRLQLIEGLKSATTG